MKGLQEREIMSLEQSAAGGVFYIFLVQISPRLLQRNSQPVNVKALSRVVSMITPEEKEPSCPMFFAMM